MVGTLCASDLSRHFDGLFGSRTEQRLIDYLQKFEVALYAMLSKSIHIDVNIGQE